MKVLIEGCKVDSVVQWLVSSSRFLIKVFKRDNVHGLLRDLFHRSNGRDVIMSQVKHGENNLIG